MSRWQDHGVDGREARERLQRMHRWLRRSGLRRVRGGAVQSRQRDRGVHGLPGSHIHQCARREGGKRLRHLCARVRGPSELRAGDV